MNKKPGVFCILLGAALILSALILYGYNQYEDQKSGDQAAAVIRQLRDNEQETDTTQTVEETTEKESADSDQPEPEEMKAVTIDGYDYIAYIRIPDLYIELPVMADWDYDKMKIAPCRQFGSTRTDDLVIAAHNYDSFFGRIKELETGAEIIITDMDGNLNRYKLDHLETLQPTDVDRVQNSGYELVLYTCTYDGSTRLTAFCKRITDE